MPRPAEAAGWTEEALARLWEEQTLPREALVTRQGLPLRVVYRGQRRRGPGPDFRGAIIATPHALLTGDVEVHLRAGDFRRHGHHRDPAYDGLVLHLVLWDDEGADTLLRSGRRVPLLALAPHLEAPRPLPWREPCRTALARLGATEVERTLDRLGDIRLRQKAAALAGEMARWGPEEALYRALVEALGYGGGREAFRALAERLPWRSLRPLLLAEREPWRARAAFLALREAAARLPFPWSGRGQRPANHPYRRLAGAASLLARYAGTGLAPALLEAVRGGQPAPLLQALTVQGGSIGRGRAIELAVNAVLPLALALADATDDRALALAAQQVYRSLGRPAAYGVTRHLDGALAPGGVTVGARRQQGMLYLQRNYCSQGGCGRCPLS